MEDRAKFKDHIYLRMAAVIAELSTCPGGNVGAVIVRVDGSVASVGVNGAPRDTLHCTDIGCYEVDGRCKRAVHAEKNAILWARESLFASEVYITRRPCSDCMAAIIQVGAWRIVWSCDGLNEPTGLASLTVELARQAKMTLERIWATPFDTDSQVLMQDGDWTGAYPR